MYLDTIRSVENQDQNQSHQPNYGTEMHLWNNQLILLSYEPSPLLSHEGLFLLISLQIHNVTSSIFQDSFYYNPMPNYFHDHFMCKRH